MKMNFKKPGCTVLLMCMGFGLFAQVIKDTNIPADTSFNVAAVYRKIKKEFPGAVPALDSVPEGIVAFRDIVYASLPETPFGKRDLHLDLFCPEREGKYPALIMVHGGGWRAGDRSLQVPMAQMISSHGFITITIEYQLSQEAKYPAAIYNIKAAIRWIRAHAQEYNIDPDRIAISGCSAGGHLASLVGLTNGIEKFEGDMGNEDYSSHVHAIIDIDGVINFMDPLSLNSGRTPTSPDVEWLGGDFYQRPDLWKEASPAYWANENSVPMLFLNSGYPRFTAGEHELIAMMNNWGIYTELHKFNIKMHPFWLFHPWVDEVVKYMVVFLNNNL